MACGSHRNAVAKGKELLRVSKTIYCVNSWAGRVAPLTRNDGMKKGRGPQQGHPTGRPQASLYLSPLVTVSKINISDCFCVPLVFPPSLFLSSLSISKLLRINYHCYKNSKSNVITLHSDPMCKGAPFSSLGIAHRPRTLLLFTPVSLRVLKH